MFVNSTIWKSLWLQALHQSQPWGISVGNTAIGNCTVLGFAVVAFPTAIMPCNSYWSSAFCSRYHNDRTYPLQKFCINSSVTVWVWRRPADSQGKLPQSNFILSVYALCTSWSSANEPEAKTNLLVKLMQKVAVIRSLTAIWS